MKKIDPQPSAPPFRIPHFAFRISPRAFSLVEVLLAIFILGIGLIMVASVFPVGANWTRQTTEESVGQTIAQDALGVIRTYYTSGQSLSPNTVLASSTPFQLQALPNFTTIPIQQRTYQFGSNNPFPAQTPKICTYFWSALIRLNTAHQDPTNLPNGILASSSYKYDLYIVVFRKGDAAHTFALSPNPLANGYAEVPFLRNLADPNFDEHLIPSLGYATYSPGQYTFGNSPEIGNAVPPIGGYGIGAQSGTVFKQVVDTVGVANNQGAAMPRPLLLGQFVDNTGTVLPRSGGNLIANEPIIYSPPPDNGSTGGSPLIYIYQTTLSF